MRFPAKVRDRTCIHMYLWQARSPFEKHAPSAQQIARWRACLRALSSSARPHEKFVCAAAAYLRTLRGRGPTPVKNSAYRPPPLMRASKMLRMHIHVCRRRFPIQRLNTRTRTHLFGAVTFLSAPLGRRSGTARRARIRAGAFAWSSAWRDPGSAARRVAWAHALGPNPAERGHPWPGRRRSG